MFGLHQLSIHERIRFMNVFSPLNYCFATTTIDRSPTFYFVLGGRANLNTGMPCGRIRTCHGGGPKIDITTTAKTHMFFNTEDERDAVNQFLKHTTFAHNFPLFLLNFVRTVPNPANDFHLEVTMAPSHGKPYSRRHPSGGLVTMAPRITSLNQVTAIIDLVLGEGAPLLVDRVPIIIPGRPVLNELAHIAEPNLTTFLGQMF